ncbi:Piwi-domain-containing protein [Aureobasidium pullulans]|nr:Piwi-domain-containing protein [Aureobasidium pullulans]
MLDELVVVYPILERNDPRASYRTTELVLQANFSEITKLPPRLCRYAITATVPSRTGPKTIANRELLKQIIANILPSESSVLCDSEFPYYTDYQRFIISPEPLPNHQLVIDQPESLSSYYDSVPPGSRHMVTVTITRLPDQGTSVLAEGWQPGLEFVDQTDVLTPLNIVSQFPVREQRPSQTWVNAARNKYFERDAPPILIPSIASNTTSCGLHLRRGFYVSVRPALGGRLLLNVNAANSAFFNEGTVAGLIGAYFARFDASDCHTLANLLKGIRLHLMYFSTNGRNERISGEKSLHYGKVVSVVKLELDPAKIRQGLARLGLPDQNYSNHAALWYRPALTPAGLDLLQISNDPLVVSSGKVLFPPDVRYHSRGIKEIDCMTGSWNLKGIKIKSSHPFDQAVFLVRQDAHDFGGFSKKCKQLVLNISKICTLSYKPHLTKVEALPNFEPATLRAWLKLKTIPPKHIFVILDGPGLQPATWADIKLFEKETGVLNTVIRADKLCTDMSFATNIALKANVQYKGTNQNVALDIPSDTMLVGGDVTHPGQTAVDGAPSIAAVVASTDSKFSQYPGSTRLQLGKQEIMTELKDMMVERLQAYRSKNDKLPNNILFFRDGVSEGQFAQVKAKEVPQVVEACEAVAGKGVKINITFIIVSKRHNARLFKVAETDKQFLDQRQENFRPGVVVDNSITCPGENDFYVLCHKALAATARSCHCFVVENEMNLSAFHLESIVFGHLVRLTLGTASSMM